MITDQNTHDILLQDMWIHGFTSRGIIGPIGGTVTATRVDIAYNGAAGWDFDDGNSTPNVNGVINLSDVTIEWNGCNQAVSRYRRGLLLQPEHRRIRRRHWHAGPEPVSPRNVDHSIFRYNTQDGYDMLHNDAGNCTMSITDSDLLRQ